MAKREKIVDDVHQITLAPNETKSIVKVLFIYQLLFIITNLKIF